MRPMAVLFRLAKYFALAFAATALPSAVGAEAAPSSESSLNRIQDRELFAKAAQPIVSIDEVIEPASTMEGDFSVHEYGAYTGRFFWMDNHRLILSAHDKDRRTTVIESWDVVSSSKSRYGFGKIMCYADGLISKITYPDGASPNTPGILQKGLIGQEIDFTFDKSIGVYDHTFECGDQPSTYTTQYVKEHSDEIVVALRKEHGFLVRAKRTMFPDGRTNQIIERNEIVFHRLGKEPRTIPVPSKNLFVAAYYPFVNAYVTYNSAIGLQNIHILLANGEVRVIKPPEGLTGSYPALTRRGLLWLRGSVMPKPDNGIYLSRGEQVKRIASENSHGGVVSPNGCRMAYTTTRVDFLGKITNPTLKVINLCTGEK